METYLTHAADQLELAAKLLRKVAQSDRGTYHCWRLAYNNLGLAKTNIDAAVARLEAARIELEQEQGLTNGRT